MDNKFADALSRHKPDENLRLRPMSKKAEEYRKQRDIQDPLVQRLGGLAGRDMDYVEMLSNIENRTAFKNLGLASLSLTMAPDSYSETGPRYWYPNPQEQN